jgi:uncharacterized membrane protein
MNTLLKWCVIITLVILGIDIIYWLIPILGDSSGEMTPYIIVFGLHSLWEWSKICIGVSALAIATYAIINNNFDVKIKTKDK